MLEGLCNNSKLKTEDDKLALRFMDELFQIEKNVGEIAAVISLQNAKEDTQFIPTKMEEFEPEVIEEKKKEPEQNSDGEDIVDAGENEGEDNEENKEKEKPWRARDHQWTITNKHAKNLPQLFRDFKGINCLCEDKKSKEFGDGEKEAVTKALDEFAARVIEDHASR